MSIKIPVDAVALHSVLRALIGPAHHIRELQATRDKPPLLTGNPIDTLIREYNAFCEAQKAQEDTPTESSEG